MTGIRGRLAMIHVAILVLLLAALGAYLFVGARETVEEARLDRLRAAVTVARATIGATGSGGDVLEEAAARIGDPGLAVLLLDGGAIVGRAGWPVRLGDDWSLPAPVAGAGGSSGFSDTPVGRVAWSALALDGANDWTVVVVGDTAGLDATLGELSGVLLLGLAIAATAGAAAIWFVTGRALAPVRRMSAAAERLASGDVSIRVPDASGSDELAQVGRAFNAMAEEVETLLRRQRSFVADASHELRTPLSALVGSLDVLEQADGENATALRRTMRSQLARLSRMADDLLLLARIDDAGAAALARRPVDLALVARDVVDEVRHLPDAAGAAVRIEASGPAWVDGDPDALHRLLLNLVVNALRHGAPPVEVRIEGRGGLVRVEVSDAGPGFPPDLQSVAFDRFRRGAARAGSHGGAGLGLSIVRAVAEAHGGTVAVAHRSPAVLVVELPGHRSGRS